MRKYSILVLFVSLILIGLCASTVVAADNADDSVNTTIQKNVVKSVQDTQTTTDTLNKTNKKINTKAAADNTYYVATNGKSSNTGTESSPFDLQTGVAQLQRNQNGNLIINGGTYKISETIKFYQGTYTITGKSGQTVILDAQNKIRHIYLGGSTNAEIKNIVFTNGKASDMGNTGGAIRADAGGRKVFTNNTFKQNYAPTYGGAIANSAENAVISNNIFINNIADVSGGAVCTTAKSTQITDNTFTQNVGGRNGGAVYTSGAGTLVNNNRFTKNLSNQTAAGVFTNTDNVTISNNIFQENTAYRTGAAVYDEGSNVKVLNNIFNKNTVKALGGIGDGAGAYLRGAKATVRDNIFIYNKAEGSGGALYLDTGGQSTASQNVFIINKADKNGGAIFTRGTKNQITNNTCIMNVASESLKPAIKDYGSNNIINNNKNADTSAYNGTVYNVGDYVTITKNIFEDDNNYQFVSSLTVSSKSSVYVGDQISINGELTACGTYLANQPITIKIDGKTYKTKTTKNGNYEINITPAKAGTKTITSIYYGTKNYTAAKATATFIANKKDTTISINNKATVYVGEKITIYGKLTTNNNKSLANQPIIIKINGKTYKTNTTKNGNYQINITPATLGKKTITVKYLGTNIYNQSYTTNTFTVNKKTSILTINCTENVYVGSTVRVYGKLTANKKSLANQTIRINVNGKTYTTTTSKYGNYNINFTATTTGNKTVTVTYKGSNTYTNSSVKATYLSTKKNSTITLKSTKSVIVGNKVCIYGKLTANKKTLANQTVTINVNGRKYNVTTNQNGIFNLNITTSLKGNKTITATYNGDNYNNKSSARTTFTVQGKDTKIIIESINDVQVTEYTCITGYLKDKNDKPLRNKTLTLTINEVELDITTDSTGKFTYYYQSNNIGNNTVLITYYGDSVYKESSAMKTFNVIANNF